MKTKFIFLLLIVGSLLKAQVFFQTPYATNITASTATLNVYMNLNNTYQVGYQISTNSNFSGAPVLDQLNTVQGVYNLTKPASGLAANTTYYIRFRALSSGVSTYSPVGSFTTQAVTPVVFSNSTSVTSNSGTINYTINANGYSTTSIIRYGLSSTTLTNMYSGFSATGTSDTVNSVTIPSLSPNTQYFYQIEATNSNGTATSSIGSFTTSSLAPIISNISTTSTSNSATISYSLDPNGATATSVINYGLSSGALNSQLTGFSASTSGVTPGSIPINSLSPNTTYYFQIVATNSNGSSVSAIGTFFTSAPNQTIAEYTFNGHTNNTYGTNPFSGNSGTSFTTDRNGAANSALNIAGQGTSATILGLPYGNAARTVSVWVKLNTSNSYNYIYTYGAGSTANGALLPNSATITNFGGSQGHSYTVSTSIGTWYHFVFSFDGTTSKIYRNGVLLSSLLKTFNTVNYTDVFRLGLTEDGYGNFFNGAIDDLQIYNYALSDSQVTNLYNAQVLATKENLVKNNEVKLYPNPVKDVLYIRSEESIKKAVVFSLEGKKITETEGAKIDFSAMVSGAYIIKIIHNEGKVETHKIIKN